MGVKNTITTIIPIGFSLLLLTTNSVFSESTDFSLPNHKPLPYFDEWPQIQSAIPKRDYIEERVADIVAQMTTW